jgi:hypothetical protein
VLALQIQNNPLIKGITIGDQEIKISLLADDITLLLNDIQSIKKTIDILKIFKNCAGLKINIEKSFAKYIGSLTTCDYFPHGLSWIKTPIKTLGISITNNPDLNYKLNFQNRITTLQNTFNIWNQRNLSLKGKITIVNNLALAPLIYVSSVTTTPDKAIVEINNIVQNFIWSNKKTKIAQNILKQDIMKGGLKLCHFGTKVKSLILSWTKRLTSPSKARWKILPKTFYNCKDLNTYFNANHKLLTKKNIPMLYIKIHENYMKYLKKQAVSRNEILDEALWLNENIKVNHKYMYISQWEQNNINKIRDLVDDFGNMLTHDQLKIKYNITTNFLVTLQIQNSIPTHWKNQIKSFQNTLPKKNNDINIIVNNKKLTLNMTTSKEIYWHIINLEDFQPTYIKKWNETYSHLNNALNEEWNNIFNLPFKTCRETKLQSFQYRLIHRIIPCNKWLFNLKILDSNMCSFCNKEIDTIQHFFLLCENINLFWKTFNNWWYRLTKVNFTTISNTNRLQQNILFGFINPEYNTTVLNYCILQAKYYIYINKLNKYNNICILDFLIHLKSKLNQEKYICETSNHMEKFEKFQIILNNI